MICYENNERLHQHTNPFGLLGWPSWQKICFSSVKYASQFYPAVVNCIMLLVANLPIQNETKTWKMIEILARGYSSESSLRDLSNEYQHDRVWTVFKNLSVLVLWIKVASALEGLIWSIDIYAVIGGKVSNHRLPLSSVLVCQYITEYTINQSFRHLMTKRRLREIQLFQWIDLP